MARPMVVDQVEGTRFPFLRGILTRSLQAAGLPVEQAYEVASEVRQELAGVSEMTTDELRKLIVKRIKPFGADVVQRYLGPVPPPEILIEHSDGHLSPFSRGRHRLSLVSCGLSLDDAATAAARIYEDLIGRSVKRLSSRALRHLTYEHLRDDLGEDAARHYLVWQEFQRSKRPLVVLVGGAVGSGKSTVAAQVAHRMEIVRTQSTDMLREVMRMMVPQNLLPVLHTSTFMAWEALPGSEREDAAAATALVDGYLTQAKLVSVACEAVIRRAMRERVSLILEGVHAHPGLMAGIERETDAIVVRAMLAVLKPSQLKARLRGRGEQEPDRRAKRYLKYFDAIWNLQSFMLSEADQLGVPIVANEDLDGTVHDVTGIVMAELARRFSGTPDEVL